MEDLNVVDSINGAGSWLVANQALLLSYAVNIVAALAIIIVGLIIARMISNAVNRLMNSRKIDATVADFLSADEPPISVINSLFLNKAFQKKLCGIPEILESHSLLQSHISSVMHPTGYRSSVMFCLHYVFIRNLLRFLTRTQR